MYVCPSSLLWNTCDRIPSALPSHLWHCTWWPAHRGLLGYVPADPPTWPVLPAALCFPPAGTWLMTWHLRMRWNKNTRHEKSLKMVKWMNGCNEDWTVRPLTPFAEVLGDNLSHSCRQTCRRSIRWRSSDCQPLLLRQHTLLQRLCTEHTHV